MVTRTLESAHRAGPARTQASGTQRRHWEEALRPALDFQTLANQPQGVVVTCAGHSMEPTLSVGDRVRVWATGELSPGCVVLFRTINNDALVLHRVIFRLLGTPYFFHVGDAEADRACQVGVAKVQQIVGYARELPPRTPKMSLVLLALDELRKGVLRATKQRRLLGKIFDTWATRDNPPR